MRDVPALFATAGGAEQDESTIRTDQRDAIFDRANTKPHAEQRRECSESGSWYDARDGRKR